jgi:hypothetical protein
MHGQKSLWSPGAWQAYFLPACLLARCPQEHTNSIFCSRPLAVLRQQMEVWFYMK